MEIKQIKNQLNAPYYTRDNLALLLGSKRRTLDYRLSKLIADDTLESVRAGLYLNTSVLKQTVWGESMLEYVGCVAKFPSYVSLEYALAKYGVLPEAIMVITYITTKKTGFYESSSARYQYRSIKRELFSDYEQRLFGANTYLFAKNYKALFDWIYLTPVSSVRDLKELLFSSRINWGVFTLSDRENFLRICRASGSKKMKTVASLVEKNRV